MIQELATFMRAPRDEIHVSKSDAFFVSQLWGTEISKQLTTGSRLLSLHIRYIRQPKIDANENMRRDWEAQTEPNMRALKVHFDNLQRNLHRITEEIGL